MLIYDIDETHFAQSFARIYNLLQVLFGEVLDYVHQIFLDSCENDNEGNHARLKHLYFTNYKVYGTWRTVVNILISVLHYDFCNVFWMNTTLEYYFYLFINIKQLQRHRVLDHELVCK